MVSTPNKKNEHTNAILGAIPNESFQVEKTFGYDYFSQVVVVRNNKLAGRYEDIKFLESVEPNTREQFVKEAKVLSAMHHNNIPKVYDFLEYNDTLLFRSEHIEGYSLKEILEALKDRNEEFPRYAAASIILKLMNALYYAHNEVMFDKKKTCIIHCDIKPSNIILSSKNYRRKNKPDGKFINLIKQNKVEPYLIDFGIAKLKGDAKNEDGTLEYLSPMQAGFADNSSNLNWRTDIYQLLLVYYEILTKKKPYSNLPKKAIIEQKLSRDFEISKKDNVSAPIKNLIEKGAKRHKEKSFKSEKECIRELSRIESEEKLHSIFNKYKKPVISAATILFIALFSIVMYHAWDNGTQSTDSIIKNIERRENPSLNELENAAIKIQKRSFEKKYYEPLIKGEFRDKKTGKPLYPSYLDANGQWALTQAGDDSAGAFTGLLFEYSDRYPRLSDYAKEYAEPILDSEFDGTSPNRFHYALIPGYEKTKDERYLKKLINVTDILMTHFNERKGMTQCADLSLAKLFLFVYEKTGDKKYLEFFEGYMKEFINNNIDDDGYIY